MSWLRKSAEASAVPVPLPDPEHRVYAIGDVHGRVDLLTKMLKQIAEDAQNKKDERKPVLVFLGDLVDRGDNTRETLDLVSKTTEIWWRSVCLLGNHEVALMSFIEDPVKGAQWLSFGGMQTCASYGVPVRNVRPDPEDLQAIALHLAQAMGTHLNLLQKMERVYRSGDVVFAHAGIDPSLPLTAQSDDALLWGRSAFLENGPPSGLRVVHGHWDSHQPVVTPSRICVDTGAYYSGRLTAVRIDGETAFLTVDFQT